MDLVRLWIHEANRVYRDKLVDQTDMDNYDKILKDAVKRSFEVICVVYVVCAGLMECCWWHFVPTITITLVVDFNIVLTDDQS